MDSEEFNKRHLCNTCELNKERKCYMDDLREIIIPECILGTCFGKNNMNVKRCDMFKEIKDEQN